MWSTALLELMSLYSMSDSYAAKDVKVVVGEWNLQSTSGYEQTVTAKRLIIHEGYQANVFNNDIAIITLESKWVISNSQNTDMTIVR